MENEKWVSPIDRKVTGRIPRDDSTPERREMWDKIERAATDAPAERRDALALRVLRVFAFDNTDQVWWRTDSTYAPVTFFAKCNDLFWWGCADLETITAANIELLEQTAAELSHDDAELYLGELFAARSRKMRPQGACYKAWPDHIKALFDACGPERQIEIGNPLGNVDARAAREDRHE